MFYDITSPHEYSNKENYSSKTLSNEYSTTRLFICPLIVIHAWSVFSGQKWLPLMNMLNFSLRSTSNDHYIEWNNSSSPTSPTINDILCKIKNLSSYYCCTICAAVSGHTAKGLAEAQQWGAYIAFASRHSGHRVACIHGVRVTARHCACCCPWLQSLAAYCCHSFWICNAQLALPHT